MLFYALKSEVVQFRSIRSHGANALASVRVDSGQADDVWVIESRKVGDDDLQLQSSRAAMRLFPVSR